MYNVLPALTTPGLLRNVPKLLHSHRCLNIILVSRLGYPIPCTGFFKSGNPSRWLPWFVVSSVELFYPNSPSEWPVLVISLFHAGMIARWSFGQWSFGDLALFPSLLIFNYNFSLACCPHVLPLFIPLQEPSPHYSYRNSYPLYYTILTFLLLLDPSFPRTRSTDHVGWRFCAGAMATMLGSWGAPQSSHFQCFWILDAYNLPMPTKINLVAHRSSSPIFTSSIRFDSSCLNLDCFSLNSQLSLISSLGSSSIDSLSVLQ